jgi:hypothetical protein
MKRACKYFPYKGVIIASSIHHKEKLHRMKKVFLIAVLVCTFSSLQAQVYVGGSLSAWRDEVNDIKRTTMNFFPEIGYGFGNNWHAGAVIGFGQTKIEDVKDNLFRLTSYVGYTFYENQIAALFVEGAFSYLRTSPITGEAFNGFEAGLNPGIKVKLSDRLGMRAHYAFLGYRDNGNDHSEFGIRMNLEELRFGFHYSF